MKEQFVPIKVWKEQDCDLWHLDVSNLNLSELILYQEYKNNDNYVQRCKKERKEEKRKIKRKQIKNSKKNWRNRK